MIRGTDAWAGATVMAQTRRTTSLTRANHAAIRFIKPSSSNAWFLRQRSQQPRYSSYSLNQLRFRRARQSAATQAASVNFVDSGVRSRLSTYFLCESQYVFTTQFIYWYMPSDAKIGERRKRLGRGEKNTA